MKPCGFLWRGWCIKHLARLRRKIESVDSKRKSQPLGWFFLVGGGGCPFRPCFGRQGRVVVAVEQLPERGAERPLAVKDGEAEVIHVRNLVGGFVNADLAFYPFCDDEKGNDGLLYNEEVLCQSAERYVHVLMGLGEYIDRYAIVSVVLEELDCRLRERFIIAVIEFNTRFVNNHFAIFYHDVADVGTRIKLERAFDRNVGVDRDFPFPVFTVNYPLGELAGESVAKTDDNAFVTILAHTLINSIIADIKSMTIRYITTKRNTAMTANTGTCRAAGSQPKNSINVCMAWTPF